MRLGELPELPDMSGWNFPRCLDYEKVLQPYFEDAPVPEWYSPAYVDLQYGELRVYCWLKVPYLESQGIWASQEYFYNRRLLDLAEWKEGRIVWGPPKATSELIS